MEDGHLEEANEVVISSSNSSVSEEETDVQEIHIEETGVPTLGIRNLITRAQDLLHLAEEQSRPEEVRHEHVSDYRYDFSFRVTANDLFRERDMMHIAEIVSILKSRLSAERVFSLGCPQTYREREIFDELLLRYSAELLDREEGGRSSTTTTSADLSHPNVGAETSVVADVDNRQPLTSTAQRNSIDIDRDTVRPSSTIPGQTPNVLGTEASDFSLSRQRDTALQQCVQYWKDSNLLLHLSPRNAEEEAECSKSVYRCLQSIQGPLSELISSTTSLCFTQSLASARKRKRTDESSPKNHKKTSSSVASTDTKNQESDDGEEDNCSICLEPWSTGGEHRVSCLKCGHLFGLSCIQKWVKQAHCCPQCKVPAKKSDLRNIFVRRITAEDTSQRDRAIRQLEEERSSRRQLEQKEALAQKQAAIQMDEMRVRVAELESKLIAGRYGPSSDNATPMKSTPATQSHTSKKQCYQWQRINIAQDSTCRVFDCNRSVGMVVVSQKSPNALFRGFGVKIMSRDFRPLSYQPLHTAVIRDISFQPDTLDGMLLSGGMDKSIQLTSINTHCVVQKYSLSSTVWCCEWNTQNTNIFYAGLERGVVREFDIRRTDTHVQDVLENGASPISSLNYWKDGQGCQGLLISHMQNLIFKEQTGDQYTTHGFLPFPASSMSLDLHSSGRFLASFRPGANLTRCRYEIGQLCRTEGEAAERSVFSTRLAVWDGSNMQAVISRNCLMSYPGTDSDLLAITANHSNNMINIWDLDQKKDLQTLTCYDKALDIKPIASSSSGASDILGVLTEKDLILYKWR